MVSCIETMCLEKSSRTEQPFMIFASVLSYTSPKLPSPEVGPTYLTNLMDFFFFEHLQTLFVFLWLWVIPAWRAASFWLSPPSCRFLWVLALGEAVKSQSPFLLLASPVVSQTYTTFHWKDYHGRFVCTFWWSVPVLYCPHNCKTTPRVMLNFPGNANIFNPIPNNCREQLNLQHCLLEPRHFFSRLKPPNSFKLPK